MMETMEGFLNQLLRIDLSQFQALGEIHGRGALLSHVS